MRFVRWKVFQAEVFLKPLSDPMMLLVVDPDMSCATMSTALTSSLELVTRGSGDYSVASNPELRPAARNGLVDIALLLISTVVLFSPVQTVSFPLADSVLNWWFWNQIDPDDKSADAQVRHCFYTVAKNQQIHETVVQKFCGPWRSHVITL